MLFSPPRSAVALTTLHVSGLHLTRLFFTQYLREDAAQSKKSYEDKFQSKVQMRTALYREEASLFYLFRGVETVQQLLAPSRIPAELKSLGDPRIT